jgi:hypothetical protein
VEAQARHEPDFAERMWRYYSLLSLRHPPPVCPLALLIYRGVGGIGWETYQRTLFDREILRFHFGRVGLLDLRDEEYLSQNIPLAIALAARMRHRRGSELDFKLRCVEKLEQTPLNAAQKSLLVQAVDHFLPLAPDEEVAFLRLAEQRRLKEVKPMLGGVERLGIVKGKQEALLDLLQARFGKVPPDLRKHILKIYDSKLLTALLKRAVTAASLTELDDMLAVPSKTEQ